MMGKLSNTVKLRKCLICREALRSLPKVYGGMRSHKQADADKSGKMKLVINECYGGYGLSPKAVKRLAELKGRPCYFFEAIRNAKFQRITLKEAEAREISYAFDTLQPSFDAAEFDAHVLDNRPEDRADPHLIQVVNELGTRAGGAHAVLKVVEIPDGIEYIIEEYDGFEHVAEKHRTWE
jgi:hypothetical protein